MFSYRTTKRPNHRTVVILQSVKGESLVSASLLQSSPVSYTGAVQRLFSDSAVEGEQLTEYPQSGERSERVCQAARWPVNRNGVKNHETYSTCLLQTAASGKEKRENLMSSNFMLMCMKLIGKQSLPLLFAPASNAPVNFPGFCCISQLPAVRCRCVKHLCTAAGAANTTSLLLLSRSLPVIYHSSCF